MLKKSTQTILIALYTSAALIGLAFYKHSGSPVNLSSDQLFVVAAIIILLPVVYAPLRCKTCRNKTPNLG